MAAAASRGLVRQNTFTKDSIELSAEPTARPVATDQSNARLITSGSKGTAWSQDSVRLVGGRIVRSRGEGSQMSPGVVRKHSDHIVVDGQQEFDTTSGAEYGEVSGDRPKLVRRKTWTKMDGEMVFKTQQQEDYQASKEVGQENTGDKEILSAKTRIYMRWQRTPGHIWHAYSRGQ